MPEPIFKSITSDLVYDLQMLATGLLPLVLVFGFFIAGAWLLDLKGVKRWPAVFAVTPLFWLFEGYLDAKPGQHQRMVHTVAAVCGFLNVVAIYIAIRSIR